MFNSFFTPITQYTFEIISEKWIRIFQKVSVNYFVPLKDITHTNGKYSVNQGEWAKEIDKKHNFKRSNV